MKLIDGVKINDEVVEILQGMISAVPVGRAIEDIHQECMICGGQRRQDHRNKGPCRLCGGRMQQNIVRAELF